MNSNLAKQPTQKLNFSKHFTGFNIFVFFVVVLVVFLLKSKFYALAWVPAALLIFFSFIIRYPKQFFYLIIFLIPFEAYTQIYESLTINKIIGLLLVITIFIHAIIFQAPLKRSSTLWTFLGAFLMISVISSLLSKFPISSIDSLRKLLTVYLFFYFTSYFFRAEDIWRSLPKVITISISISAFLAVIGYLFHIESLTRGSSLTRATGVEHDPNLSACMVIFSLPFICHYLFSTKRTLGKVIYILMFSVNITSVILSYSRAGAIVAAFGLILILRFYYHYLTPKKLGFTIIAIFVVLSVFSLTTPMSYWDRLGSVTKTKEDTSLGRRWSYLEVAKEQFSQNPLLGSGPGTFRDYYESSRYALEFQKEGKTNRRAAHNAYVEVLVGTGLIGLVCYLTLLYRGLRLFKQAVLTFTKKGNEELASLSNAYNVALITVLGYSLFLSNLYLEYIWLCLGASQLVFNLSSQAPTVDNEVNV